MHAETTAQSAREALVRAVPVLMYHSVSSSASRRFRPFAVSPVTFTEHLRALVDARWDTRTVGEYLATAEDSVGGALRPPQENTVVLTFDDAFSDFHSEVMPQLSASGLRATLYVPTAYVESSSRWLSREGEGGRRLMSWSQLREVADSGIEIGSHSRTHRQLDLLPRKDLRTEVRDSKLELEDRLQQPVSTFAYPFGYHDRRVKAAVVEAGYTSACAVRDLRDRRGDSYAVNRLTVTGGMTAESLLSALGETDTGWDDRKADVKALASRVLRRAGLKRRGPTHDDGIA